MDSTNWQTLAAELKAQNAQLALLLAKANERIAELEAIVKRLQKQKKKKPEKSEAAKEERMVPSLSDPQQQTAFNDRPLPPVLEPREKPVPQPQTPTGRKPLPGHLPEDFSQVCPDCCAHCGAHGLDKVGEVLEEKLHVVKEHQRRRVVKRVTMRCRDCLRRTTGESLPAPYERSKVTCDWLAWFIVTKFYLLVPIDRIRRMLALQGINLSMGTLVLLVERATDLLATIDGEIWKQLKAGGWMQADGTGLKVLVEGLSEAYKGYLEVFRREALVVFQYVAQKDGETFAAKFKEFFGILLVDAESRNNEVFASGKIKEAGCNAHGRRKFEAAETVQPKLAVEGGQFLSAIFAIEAEAQKNGLNGEALKNWRQTRILPIYDRFRIWMEAVQPTLLPSDLLNKSISYYKNHWAALTLWLSHSELPPDNSGAEREFQTIAKARLSWLFAGSTEGAHRIATIMGVMATARNVGVNLQAYFTWVFERNGTHAKKYGLSAKDLTPMAYKASLAGTTS